MLPTEALVEEHGIILAVLDAARRYADEVRRAKGLDPTKIAAFLDFFVNFADGYHHAREERQLFAHLMEHGMSDRHGPISIMLQEHRMGREQLRLVRDALPAAAEGNPEATRQVAEHLTAYTALLRAHIEKEDKVLYPFADRMLTPEEQDAIRSAFEAQDDEFGRENRDRYLALGRDLSWRPPAAEVRPAEPPRGGLRRGSGRPLHPGPHGRN